jgi:hypothetical protein
MSAVNGEMPWADRTLIPSSAENFAADNPDYPVRVTTSTPSLHGLGHFITPATSQNGSQLPPPATPAIDWEAVGFKVHTVNGHAHCAWTNGKWSRPDFRSEEYLSIHGFASCLNYGQVFLLREINCSNVLKD